MDNRQEFDLEGWKFIFTLGSDMDIYGKGLERVGICNGKAIIFYKVKRGNMEKEVKNGASETTDKG